MTPGHPVSICPGWLPLARVLSAVWSEYNVFELALEYRAFYMQLIGSHGQKTAVAVLKDLRSVVSLHALGVSQKRVVTLGGIWFSLGPNKLPSQLRKLSLVKEGDIQLVLDILGLVNTLTTTPSEDVTTITSCYTGRQDLNHSFLAEERKVFGTLVQQLKSAEPRDVGVEPLHLSLKAGPNAPSAILSALADAIALVSHEDTWVRFQIHASRSGRDHLVWRIESFIESYVRRSHDWVPSSVPVNAKLAFLAQKAGKTRVVYVANYWIQELLLPLHRILMKWLSSQVQDGTYNQSKAVAAVQEWTREGRPVWSFDLTAATDRWPRLHQYQALVALVGEMWADLWLFCMEINPTVKLEEVEYRVGQPMGAYASWAAFSVTHHLTLRSLAKRLGVDSTLYRVLGDDVVIADERLAQAYIEKLRDLGVDISTSKSVTAESLPPGISSAEFAKQLLKNGLNLSPISSQLCIECFQHKGNPVKIATLCKWLSEARGLGFNAVSDTLVVSPVIARLLNNFNEDVQQKVLTLLGADPLRRPSQLNGIRLYTQGAVTCTYLDPWAKADKSTILYYYAEECGSKLAELAHNLLKLRDKISAGGSPDIGSNYGLNFPAHPVWDVITNLEEATRKALIAINNGEEPEGMADLLIDSDYLTKVVLGGGTHREWRILKDLRSTVYSTVAFKVLSAACQTTDSYSLE